MQRMNQPDPTEDAPPPPPGASILDHASLMSGQVLGPPTSLGSIGTVGSYPVLRTIGFGGMGIVVVAREPSTARLVAIKLLRPELRSSATAVKRFIGEARHMRQLDHPNILKILNVGDDTAAPHYVMPYMPRGSLAHLLVQSAKPDLSELVRLARQVAEGIAFAHSRGLIHRDIKPANVLIGDDGTAYVCDFGLVRTVFNDTVVDASREQREGSAPYMSPAVARGEAEDTRCDIYSFGAMLYEMLTGRPPYEGRSTQQIVEKIRAGPPESIRKISPEADARLTKVAESCMARELRDRYTTMDDVVADIGRIQENENPHGPRGARLRNHRSKWLTAAGVLAVLASIPFWLGWHRSAPQSTPYQGMVHDLGRIEFEYFDEGGEGVGWHDRTSIEMRAPFRDANVGMRRGRGADPNHMLTFVEPGEWLQYTVNLPHAGPWDLVIKANCKNPGNTVHVEVDGKDVTGPIELAASNQAEWTLTRVSLPALPKTGACKLRFCFDSAGGSASLLGLFDWFALVPPRGWPVAAPREIAAAKIPDAMDQGIWSVATNNTGDLIATGHANGELGIWSTKPLTLIRQLKYSPGGVTHKLAFSKDSSLLAAGLDVSPWGVLVWDVAAGTNISQWSRRTGLPASQFADDGRSLLIGTSLVDGTSASIVDAADPARKIIRTIKTHGGVGTECDDVAWMPDQRHVLAAHGNDRSAWLYDAITGTPLRGFYGHTDTVRTLDVSSDGRRLLTGSIDRTVRLWDIETGACLQVFQGHLEHVYDVTFCEDGKTARSASLDGSTIQWDLDSGKPIQETPFLSREFATTFSKDGRRLIAGTPDSRLLILELPENARP